MPRKIDPGSIILAPHHLAAAYRLAGLAHADGKPWYYGHTPPRPKTSYVPHIKGGLIIAAPLICVLLTGLIYLPLLALVALGALAASMGRLKAEHAVDQAAADAADKYRYHDTVLLAQALSLRTRDLTYSVLTTLALQYLAWEEAAPHRAAKARADAYVARRAAALARFVVMQKIKAARDVVQARAARAARAASYVRLADTAYDDCDDDGRGYSVLDDTWYDSNRYDPGYDDYSLTTPTFNTNGIPMLDGCVDVCGNPYGTD